MFNPLNWIFGIDRLLARVEGFLLVSILIVMLFFASLQVILRNFFDTGIEWGDVFARHLVLWVGFFGATLATKEERHIRIDALAKVISKKWQPVVELLVTIFCIVTGTLLFSASYRFMLGERLAETTLFEGIPTWYFISIMPVGFAIITYRYFVHLVEMLLRFGGKKRPAHKPSDKSEFEISVKVKLT